MEFKHARSGKNAGITRKALGLILTALTALGLCACGASNENAGTYYCVAAQVAGEDVQLELLYPEGIRLDLYDDGSGLIVAAGTRGSVSWSLDGNDFVLNSDLLQSQGSLEDGRLSLKLAQSQVVLSFLKQGNSENTAEPEESAAAEAGELDSMEQWWDGGWYGWWRISNAQGEWLILDGLWYDCCASIGFEKDGTAQLIIWDEDCSAQEPMAQVSLEVSGENGLGEMGGAVSLDGYFWLDELSQGEWSINPVLYIYDDLICVENGHYQDEGGSFDYEIYLRPWGRVWDDIEAAEPDKLPYYYYDWYLPLVQAQADMPDVINAPDSVPVE